MTQYNQRKKTVLVIASLFAVLACFGELAQACDTFVALGRATKDGSVIFAKNSDRPSVEAQPLKFFPRTTHTETDLKCTHITIPQVKETYANIGSNIWWIYGYEMGMNEWGVVIGNEAQRSKEPLDEKDGLIGMDMIRLALERSKTAYEAMHMIIDLLGKYGQGGSCQYPEQWDAKTSYQNSFIIADPQSAWVLELAGRYWVAKKVKDVWAISNDYTIETEFDESHPDLIKHAIAMGWCKSEKDFNFSRAYGAYQTRTASGAIIRQQSNLQMLNAQKGRITVEYMMQICRNHHEGTIVSPRWTPNESQFAETCAHDTPGGKSHTAASLVAHLRKDAPDMLRQVYWQSFSNPCVNVFQPFYFAGQTVPQQYGVATNKYAADSPWWQADKIKRLCDINYGKLAPVVQKTFSQTEQWELKRIGGVENQALRLIKQGKQDKAQQLLADFCRTNTSRISGEYASMDKTLTEMVPSVGMNYLWPDWLRENCKINALELPGLNVPDKL